MSQRTKIIVLSVGFIIILLVVWLVMFRAPDDQGNSREPQTLEQILANLSSGNVAVPVGGTVATPVVQQRPLSVSEEAEQELRDFVRNFVERFGTYSNQTDFSDVFQLKEDMVPGAHSFVDQYVRDIQREHPYQDGYYGITTTAAAVNPVGFTMLADAVTVRVSARRQISTDGTGPVTTTTQDAEVRVVKQGDAWKVQSIYWQ